MEQTCGIYKITNLANGKCYIGQSVNISSRWKQHTQSLDKVKNSDEENPLRRAFLKYGLLDQISQPGVYGNFKFEVLSQCPKEELTEQEYAKIAELQPEYNRMMCPPSEDRMWPQKPKLERCCYVQYHNFEDMGHLPFEGFTENDWENESGYTTTKKRDVLKLKGEKVYLILGIKQKGHKRKDYFLWEYTLIEEVDIVNFGQGLEYGVRGTHYICKKPMRLNDLPGFDHFAKNTMGSFAYGFQNVINDPFHEIIENESNFVIAKDSGMTGLEWLANFEDELDDENLWMTERDDDDKPYWNFFSPEENNPLIAWVRARASNVLEGYFDFFKMQFKQFIEKNPSTKNLVIPIRDNLKNLISDFPQINFKVLCGHYHESWNDYVYEIMKLENVHLIGPDYASLYYAKKINGENGFITFYNRNAAGYWPDFSLDNPPHKGWGRMLAIQDECFIGKRIYNIVSLLRNGKKELYLWNYIDVKEIESDGVFKTLWGPVFLCKQPFVLDDKLLLEKKSTEFIELISRGNDYISLSKVDNELEWLYRFEENSQIEEEWRDSSLDKNGKIIYTTL